MRKLTKLSAACFAVLMGTASAAYASEQADVAAAIKAAQEAVAAAQKAEAAAIKAQKAAELAQKRAEAAQAEALAQAKAARMDAQAAKTDALAARTAVESMPEEGAATQSADAGWKPTFDFHGYFRSGLGLSRNDANMEWQKSKLGRLGNERDTYGELEFGAEVYRLNDVSFYVDSMLSMVSDGNRDDESLNNDDDVTFGLRQFNLQIKGLIPGAPDAVIWGGKRFYQRHDIHIIDSKYWNISGAGAGIEYLPVGPGTFSFAWIRNGSNNVDYRYDTDWNINNDPYKGTQNQDINYIDLRYAGLRPWQGAWTEFGIDVAIPDDADAPATNHGGEPGHVDGNPLYDNGTGVMLTAELSQDMFGGYNKTVLQYATGALAQNMVTIGGGWYDSWSDNENAWGLSLINTGEIPINNKFSFTHVLHYGYVDGDGTATVDDVKNVDDIQMFRAVARTSYQMTQYMRFLTELGMFIEKANQSWGGDYLMRGQKYTVALAFAPSTEILSRPELRLYASYLHSSDGRLISNSKYNGEEMYEDNWNIGVQAEAWW